MKQASPSPFCHFPPSRTFRTLAASAWPDIRALRPVTRLPKGRGKRSLRFFPAILAARRGGWTVCAGERCPNTWICANHARQLWKEETLAVFPLHIWRCFFPRCRYPMAMLWPAAMTARPPTCISRAKHCEHRSNSAAGPDPVRPACEAARDSVGLHMHYSRSRPQQQHPKIRDLAAASQPCSPVVSWMSNLAVGQPLSTTTPSHTSSGSESRPLWFLVLPSGGLRRAVNGDLKFPGGTIPAIF